MIQHLMLSYVRTCTVVSAVCGVILAFAIVPEFNIEPSDVDMSTIPHYQPSPEYANKPLLCRDDPTCRPNDCKFKLARAKSLVEKAPNQYNVQQFMNITRECTKKPLKSLKKNKFREINRDFVAAQSFAL